MHIGKCIDDILSLSFSLGANKYQSSAQCKATGRLNPPALSGASLIQMASVAIWSALEISEPSPETFEHLPVGSKGSGSWRFLAA